LFFFKNVFNYLRDAEIRATDSPFMMSPKEGDSNRCTWFSLHEGDRWLAVHIGELTVGRGVPLLPDGAVYGSSGRSSEVF